MYHYCITCDKPGRWLLYPITHDAAVVDLLQRFGQQNELVPYGNGFLSDMEQATRFASVATLAGYWVDVHNNLPRVFRRTLWQRAKRALYMRLYGGRK